MRHEEEIDKRMKKERQGEQANNRKERKKE